MRAGRRRNRVTFHGPPIARTSDGEGGAVETLTLLGGRFVEKLPATAANVERLLKGQVVGTISHLMTGPAVPGVTLSSEVHEGDRVYQVRGIGELDPHGVYQVFAVDERRA